MAKIAPAPRALARAFVAALPEPERARLAADDALDMALRRALDTFRAAFPDVEIDDATCAAALARAAPDQSTGPSWLDALQTAELLLASACARGDRRAIAIFERHYLAHVGDFIAHVDRTAAFVDEVKQTLRQRLLVGADGRAPKIGEYRGAGALGGWVRVAAVRIALNLKRSDERRREVAGDEERDLLGGAAPDPETPHLRRLLGDDFRHALEATLSALPASERNVLRMHYLDGLSIDELAPLHQVHRATVARWIERARKRVLEETRRRLGDRLGVQATSEIDSIVRLVQTELDVSVARLLRETDQGR